MGKRIISLQEAQSITNDDYLVIDNQSSGTKKVSAGFINDIVSDVEVDGTSVVNNGVAEIDLSGKQDTIVAGSNITIAADGKTISATDTTYTAGTNVQINNGVISATDTTYTAGTNVDITGGVISATDTTYTAGTNVTIDANNVISASDTTYSAGTNVQINNGVISATDTTYSAFGGATAGADGSSGLVPQPLIADKDKFLKGDGTWDTIQPGASALDDLTNVDITSPTNGQVLKYDSANQEWVNANESGGGGGSTVTITPTLSTGTKIADYSIDGSTGALYAPSGGGGGISSFSGTTAPTSSQGSNGDIYMQYKAGEITDTIFTGTESTRAWDNPVVIDIPNASNYNSFDITYQFFYFSTSPIFNGTETVNYADLTTGELYKLPESISPDYGVDNCVYAKIENNKLYMYIPDTYYLYVYEVVGHSNTAPTKINHLYGKISNIWVESSNAEEISLPDYNALTTAQKNDGTIRFIPESNIGTSNVVDMSNVTNAYIEGAMSLTSSSDEIAVVWNGNSNCGLDSYLTAKIDVTDYDYITYDLTTGNTYDYLNPGSANPIRNLGIGLCLTTPSTSGWTNQTQITWVASNIYNGTSDANKTMSGEVIDVSSLTGEYYFVMCCAGWSFTIEDLTLATAGGNVSQIRYMSNTYAEVDVAEEMALVDYNALTTDQKNDGTIRFIPAGSGGGATTPYDMSSISSLYAQGSMRLTATSSTETTVEYIGGQQIGCNWNYPTPIDVTNISTIHFKATNGSCYGGGTQAQQTNWNLQIGLTASAIGDQALNISASDSRWAAVADMPLANHVYEESIDVSELTGSYYLLVVAHGWNTVIEDITLDTGDAYPSQIKYMSKTYGESNLISYSTTEHQVGTWIDGSDVYEKSFEIQITSTDPIIIEQDASYIDALLSFEGSCKSSAGLMAGSGMSVNTGWGFAVHRNASNQLVLYGNPTAVLNGTAYVTIRYTKVAAS